MDTQLIDSDAQFLNQEKSFGSPLIQEMSKALNLDNFEFPFIVRNKILMDEGTWNNHFYSAAEIAKAFSNTNWEEGNSASLFTEHRDKEADKWLGTVINRRMEGKSLIGDLIVNDLNFALKLQTGKPKFGISPRVAGSQPKGSNAVVNFVFDNFSIVMNPAVKTTYLNSVNNGEGNNSVVLTRTASVNDVSKNGIKINNKMSGGNNMAEEETKTEPKPEEKPEAAPAPEAEGEGKAKEEAPKEEAPVEKETAEEKDEEKAEETEELAQKQAKIDALKSLLSELEGDVEKKAIEAKSAAMDSKLSILETKLDLLAKQGTPVQAVVPDRRSINVGEGSPGSGDVQRLLNQYKANPERTVDREMGKFVTKMALGGTTA